MIRPQVDTGGFPGRTGCGIVGPMEWWGGGRASRRAELLALGVTDDELRRGRDTGSIERLARGCYLPAETSTKRYPEDLHRERVRAIAPTLSPDVVISHQSAAALHGLDLWAVPLNRVHASRQRDNGGRIRPTLHVHTTRLAPYEVCTIDGIPVTTIPRTVADLARALPFEQAVVVADSALRRRGVDLPALLDAVDRATGRKGAAAARRVVLFAAPGTTDAGESRSRVAIHRAGLPTPLLQQQVNDGYGGWLATVDFLWRSPRPTIGEFDGRVKYSRGLLRPGQEPGDVVYEEKVREDLLRAESYGFVRWGWRDLRDFAPTAARIRRALGV